MQFSVHCVLDRNVGRGRRRKHQQDLSGITFGHPVFIALERKGGWGIAVRQSYRSKLAGLEKDEDSALLGRPVNAIREFPGRKAKRNFSEPAGIVSTYE